MSAELIAEIPSHRRPEREYVLSVLLRDWLGIDTVVRVVEGSHETRLRPTGVTGGTSLVIPDVLFAPSTPWLSRDSLPGPDFPRVSLSDHEGADVVPLLFAGPGEPLLVQPDSGQVRLGFDLLGALFFLLTRYEEYVDAPNRDERGRFPASASVLADWVAWPVADMYVHAFSQVLGAIWPGMRRPQGEPSPVWLSSDLDHPAARMRWHGRQRFRVLGSDLVRRRDPGLAIRRTAGFLPSSRLHRLDPYDTFEFLMDVAESVGVTCTFFFLTRDAAVPAGTDYSVRDPWAGVLMHAIADRGHRIGLHGSYLSSTDPERLAAEWHELATAQADVPSHALVSAIRQHYLMWTAGVTWHAQAEAGLEVDESLGYADEIGYRAGTARAFRAFDIGRRQVLPLTVRPLHVMDVTLTQYRHASAAEILAAVASLGDRTRRYGGRLSLLWHNSSLETGSDRRLYRHLVHEVAPGR